METLAEELTDIVNAMVIQTIDHTFDHSTGLPGLAKIIVVGQRRLLGT